MPPETANPLAVQVSLTQPRLKLSPSIAYPGPEGSHTAGAAEALFPSRERKALPSFRAVADDVVSGEAEYGVLPIESSLSGSVAETHDLLYERSLSIVAETVLPIRHQLAALPGTSLDRITVLRSHPAAFEQCRVLLARLPNARIVPAATTAEAARVVATGRWQGEAAIAGDEAVRLYGLEVVADDVGDSPAFTRFVSVAAHTSLAARGETARTAFTFVTEHQPGALFAAIEPFARAGLDLIRLVSRPLPATPWRYRFDAVVCGHPLDADLRLALRELTERAAELRVVGVYEGAV